jgi:hypothetical protein
MTARLAALALLWIAAPACDRGSSEPVKPSGGLGLRWGDDADAAAAELGMACTWEPETIGDGRFERCTSERRAPDGIELVGDDVEAYGLFGFVRLHRRSDALVGLDWWSQECTQDDYRAFRSRVATEVGLSEEGLMPDDPLGRRWSSGASVHARRDDDYGCLLSLASDVYGGPRHDANVAEALHRFVGSLQPR